MPRLNTTILLLAGLFAAAASIDAGVNTWTTNGPYGGFMEVVAMDPGDPATLYAGTFDGRIFKTADAGRVWFEVFAVDSVIEDLVVAPSGIGAVYAATRGGIFRSGDGGATWSAARRGLSVLDVRALAADPLNANTLYAGTAGDGVFKSTDGGATWFRASVGLVGQDVRALAVDPSNPNVLYAATRDGGVSKSVNAAAAWLGSGAGLTVTDVRALAIDPFDSATLYAGTWSAGVFTSADAAESWAAAHAGIETASVSALVVEPANSNTLYAGTEAAGVFRSFNAAASWTAADSGLGSVDVRSLAIDPTNPNTLFVATFGGGGVSRTLDGATTWSARNAGLDGTVIEAIAFDPLDADTLYVGTMLDGIFKSTDGGASWAAADRGLTDLFVRALAVDPSSPHVLYAGTFRHGVFKSSSAGVFWTAVNEGLPDTVVRRLAIDPSNPGTLYAGTLDGVFKSIDAGANWSAASDGLAELPVDALALDPANPKVVYAGTRGGGVFRSAGSAAGWSPASAGLTDLVVRALAVDPERNENLYAATATGIFRSVDGAATWSLSEEGPTDVRSLAIDPEDPQTIYAGTVDDGVWKSADGGVTWMEPPLPPLAVPVQALAVDPADPARLFAGTFGAAVLELTQVPDALGGRVWHDADADGLQDDGEEGVEGVAVRLLDDQGALLDATATDSDGLYRFLFQVPGSYVVEVTAPPGYLSSPLDQGPDEVDSDVDPSTGRTGVLVLTGDGAVAADAGLYRLASVAGRVWRDTDGDGIRDPGEEGAPGVGVRLNSPDASFAVDTATDDSGVYAFAGLEPGRYRLRVTAPGGTSFSPRNQGGDDTVDSDVSSLGVSGLILVSSGEEAPVDAGLVPVVEPDPTRLELQDGRFTVDVDWKDFRGARGPGTVASVAGGSSPAALGSQDSAVVEFFGPNNWEVLIKVLDGRAVNGRFWVFFAAATNVAFTVHVTDTSCGDVKRYANPAGVAAPAVTDTMALPGCSEPVPPSCLEGGDDLCLGEGGRFRVRIAWRDFAGESGSGRQVYLPEPGRARSDDSGLFYFFSEDNWELLVKVLDGCAINNHFWVFSAATTNVEYTMRVTDRSTGVSREYKNPLGVSADALNDTAAFAACE